MQTFEITANKTIIYTYKYRVEAHSEEDARDRISNCEEEPIDELQSPDTELNFLTCKIL